MNNLDAIIGAAILEDVPSGDLTTSSLNFSNQHGEAHLVAKEDLILSGAEPVAATYARIAPEAQIKWNFSDGELVLRKQVVAVIEGDLLQILKAERIALNFLGRLCGIATLTGCFVKQVEHTKCKILDTRKTLPGYRALEKAAVRHGGGENHRMSLSDAILIKENHIRVAGGIRAACERIRLSTKAPIEIEVRNLDEVRQACEMDVQRIMLDNFDNETTAQALEIIPLDIETEASGNMTMDRVRSVAELGVHYISVGAITHSAPCADLSLLFQWDPL